jgi:hypothetical protein
MCLLAAGLAALGQASHHASETVSLEGSAPAGPVAGWSVWGLVQHWTLEQLLWALVLGSLLSSAIYWRLWHLFEAYKNKTELFWLALAGGLVGGAALGMVCTLGLAPMPIFAGGLAATTTMATLTISSKFWWRGLDIVIALAAGALSFLTNY